MMLSASIFVPSEPICCGAVLCRGGVYTSGDGVASPLLAFYGVFVGQDWRRRGVYPLQKVVTATAAT